MCVMENNLRVPGCYLSLQSYRQRNKNKISSKQVVYFVFLPYTIFCINLSQPYL